MTYSRKPIPCDDIRFLVPIARWYKRQGELSRKKLQIPMSALNALDSLTAILEDEIPEGGLTAYEREAIDRYEHIERSKHDERN